MQAFYKQYLLSLIQDGFAVMTDSLHKLVFQIHPMLLRSIFHIVQNNQVTVPLFDPSSQLAGTTNQALLHDHFPMSQLACTTNQVLLHYHFPISWSKVFEIYQDCKAWKACLIQGWIWPC